MKPACIGIFDIMYIFACEVFYTCLLFRQTSPGQYGTVYRLRGAMPEDVWVRLSGVFKGNTSLPIIHIYFGYFRKCFFFQYARMYAHCGQNSSDQGTVGQVYGSQQNL